jgi:selenocysteine lyase/cysteine desulfurase
MPLHAHLGRDGTWPDTSLRASAYVYNRPEDADRLVEALGFARQALTRRRAPVHS